MEPKNIATQLLKTVESMVDPQAPAEQQLAQMRAQMAALSELPNLINQKLESVNKQITQISVNESTKKEFVQEQSSVEFRKHKEAQQTHQYHQQQFKQKSQSNRRVINPKSSVEITEMTPEEEARRGIQIRVTKPSLTGEGLDALQREELRRSLEDLRMRKSVSPTKDRASQTNQKEQRTVHRKPAPAFGSGTVERPLYLPGGRRWKMSDYDEDQISETLVGQAEVIKGKAMGVNFKKFEKPPVGLDHLKHSEVYRAVHNLDDEPLKKVQMFRPRAFAEAEIRERVRSMSPANPTAER